MRVVCDTAKVRFFKQITTARCSSRVWQRLFAILQKYDFSSKSQLVTTLKTSSTCCLRYCKSTIFQANHNQQPSCCIVCWLFAILQKYDFSSKSQLLPCVQVRLMRCLRYCKSTIFQANHNRVMRSLSRGSVVCDTAKVRFFKQITTLTSMMLMDFLLFAILQKYDFSSKSQLTNVKYLCVISCLRYCKSTIFQANHNSRPIMVSGIIVVCDTAKVRFFKQITTYF